jgi:hypothetical protein
MVEILKGAHIRPSNGGSMQHTLDTMKSTLQAHGFAALPKDHKTQLDTLKAKVFTHIESQEKTPLPFDKILVIGKIARFFYTIFAKLHVEREFQKVNELIDISKEQQKLEEFDDEGFTQLTRAVVEGNMDKVQELAKAGANLNARDGNSKIPLFLAIACDKADMIQALAGAGANVMVNAYGWTPLNLAISGGQADMIQELADAGADLNAVDERGFTPLTWALSFGKPGMIQALADAGANLNAADGNGWTPMTLAEKLLEEADGSNRDQRQAIVDLLTSLSPPAVAEPTSPPSAG